MNEKAVVDAIQDLARITIALSGKVESKSDAIRKLDALAIPPTRIASILAMNAKDVNSIICRERKKLSGKPKGQA